MRRTHPRRGRRGDTGARRDAREGARARRRDCVRGARRRDTRGASRDRRGGSQLSAGCRASHHSQRHRYESRFSLVNARSGVARSAGRAREGACRNAAGGCLRPFQSSDDAERDDVGRGNARDRSGGPLSFWAAETSHAPSWRVLLAASQSGGLASFFTPDSCCELFLRALRGQSGARGEVRTRRRRAPVRFPSCPCLRSQSARAPCT